MYPPKYFQDKLISIFEYLASENLMFSYYDKNNVKKVMPGHVQLQKNNF